MTDSPRRYDPKMRPAVGEWIVVEKVPRKSPAIVPWKLLVWVIGVLILAGAATMGVLLSRGKPKPTVSSTSAPEKTLTEGAEPDIRGYPKLRKIKVDESRPGFVSLRYRLLDSSIHLAKSPDPQGKTSGCTIKTVVLDPKNPQEFVVTISKDNAQQGRFQITNVKTSKNDEVTYVQSDIYEWSPPPPPETGPDPDENRRGGGPSHSPSGPPRPAHTPGSTTSGKSKPSSSVGNAPPKSPLPSTDLSRD